MDNKEIDKVFDELERNHLNDLENKEKEFLGGTMEKEEKMNEVVANETEVEKENKVKIGREEIFHEIRKNIEEHQSVFDPKAPISLLNPYNSVTNNYYHGGENKFTLATEAAKRGTTDNRFLTFSNIASQQMKISTGAKAYKINRFVKDDEGKYELKQFAIYNGKDIEKMPAKIEYNLNENYKEIIDKFKENLDFDIYESDKVSYVYYDKEKNTVSIPKTENDKQYLNNLMRGTILASGHELNRNSAINYKGNQFNKAREVLTAEIGALFLQSKLNVDLREPNKNLEFTKDWLDKSEKHTNISIMISNVLNEAEKASNYVLEKYNEKDKEYVVDEKAWKKDTKETDLER